MKLSKYNVMFEVDEVKSIIYNTLTKKYHTYDTSKNSYINKLLENLNEDKYELKDAELLKDFIRKGLVIGASIDEMEILKFKEANSRFQDQTFYLTIQPTLDCNFRCTYCYEEHKKLNIDASTMDKILKFTENITKNVKTLRIGWFGGEPTLQFDKIIELTDKLKDICNKNSCNYKACMTTNGYLFDDKMINMLEELCIEKIQITLDGSREHHNKQRPLVNGDGTYDKIKENILKLLDKNVHVTLRINVSEENYNNICDVFDIIPEERRKDISLNMANLYDNNGKLDLYRLYKLSIDKGYKYYDIAPSGLQKCEAGCKSSFLIEPNGNICPCSPAGENGLHFGALKEDGTIKFDNPSDYYKFQNLSVFDSNQCRECIKLPMCMGGCKLSRFKNLNVCNGCRPDGTTLHEKIKLHYYSDLKHNSVKEKNIV